MRTLPLIVIVLCLLTFPSPSHSAEHTQQESLLNSRLIEVGGFPDPHKVEAFLSDLKHYVKEGDKPAISKMISYPISVYNDHNEQVKINSPNDFISKYNMIFTDRIKKAVLQQSYDDLFVNSDGIMIGPTGELWVAGIIRPHNKISILIVTINNNACGSDWINIHKNDPDLISVYVQQLPDNLDDSTAYAGKHPAMIIYFFKGNKAQQTEFTPSGHMDAKFWFKYKDSDWTFKHSAKGFNSKTNCSH